MSDQTLEILAKKPFLDGFAISQAGIIELLGSKVYPTSQEFAKTVKSHITWRGRLSQEGRKYVREQMKASPALEMAFVHYGNAIIDYEFKQIFKGITELRRLKDIYK